MSVLVSVRVSPGERDMWKRLAERDGVSLSEFIRFAVNGPARPSAAVRKFSPDFKVSAAPRRKRF